MATEPVVQNGPLTRRFGRDIRDPRPPPETGDDRMTIVTDRGKLEEAAARDEGADERSGIERNYYVEASFHQAPVRAGRQLGDVADLGDRKVQGALVEGRREAAPIEARKRARQPAEPRMSSSHRLDHVSVAVHRDHLVEQLCQPRAQLRRSAPQHLRRKRLQEARSDDSPRLGPSAGSTPNARDPPRDQVFPVLRATRKRPQPRVPWRTSPCRLLG